MKVGDPTRLPLPSIVQELRVIGIDGPLVPCADAVHESPAVNPEPLVIVTGLKSTTADVGDRVIDAAARTGGNRPAGL